MVEAKYNLYFDGKIQEDKSIDQVKANLSKIFKKDLQTIEKLFSGKSILLKKGLSKDMALKYRSAFQRAGAKCRFVHTQQDTAGISLKTKPGQSRSVQSAQSMVICPHCGGHQQETETCRICGTSISDYKEQDDGILAQIQRFLNNKGISNDVQKVGIILLSLTLLGFLIVPKFIKKDNFAYIYKNEIPEFPVVEMSVPADLSWDFGGNQEYKYHIVQKAENTVEMLGSEYDDLNQFNPTQITGGDMTISSNGNGTGTVYLENMKLRMDMPSKNRAMKSMGFDEMEIPNSSFIMSENGKISNAAYGPQFMLKQLFLLPHQSMNMGETYTMPGSQYFDFVDSEQPLEGSVDITNMGYVSIGDQICSKFLINHNISQTFVSPMIQGRSTMNQKGSTTVFFDVLNKCIVLARMDQKIDADIDAKFPISNQMNADRVRSSMGSHNTTTIVLKDCSKYLK